jgi:hypothetical protein
MMTGAGGKSRRSCRYDTAVRAFRPVHVISGLGMTGRVTFILVAGLLCGLTAACSSFKSDTQPDGGSGGPGDSGSMMIDATEAAADGSMHDAPTTIDVAQAESGNPSDGASTQDAPGASDGGSIEVVVDNLNQATLVRVDANNVYFGDEGTTVGVVYQCPKTGCTTPVVLGPGYATGMGVDATNVYWNDFSGGTVVSCAIGGCANQPTVIAPNQPQAEGVAFDGTNLFWATMGNIVTCTAPSCATRTTIATGQASTITLLAAQTGVGYWVSGGSVEACAAAGCANSPSKISAATGSSIVVNGSFAYFTNGNAVQSCPVGGGCATPHTIGSSNDTYGLGTDGVDVYWLDDLDQAVYRCPVTGCTGSAQPFAQGQLSQPGANVALDGEYAYWTTAPQLLRKHK